MSYLYQARLTPTSISAGKTLIQILPVTATILITRIRINQVTTTSTELLAIQQNKWTGGFTPGTVTSFTPTKVSDTADPASLAVGGTAATGYNASVEPSGGTQVILDEDVWNELNGSWFDAPDSRFIRNGEMYTLKLVTSPGGARVIGALVEYREFN